ncbi:MAG: BlaI/MecI/CopY family transcriptional regulator [Muribaculaceae bacterium]|nr:BlaI/MecI/CopY family transcriptional regulator [Muribaculaceae bacterium]
MKTKQKKLTEKEAEIMQRLWNKGPQTVRELIEDLPEPKPHFSTVSTVIRVLIDKGFVEHVGLRNGAYTYGAIVESEEMGEGRLVSLVKNYFNNSYMKVVSTLVKEEKISIQELRELIEMVEKEAIDK